MLRSLALICALMWYSFALATTPAALLIAGSKDAQSHADLVAQEFRSAGWLVSTPQARDRDQLRRSVEDFARGTPAHSMALVYLVGEIVDGKGKSRDGKYFPSKFLVSESSSLKNENDARNRGLGMYQVLETLRERSGSTRLTVLMHHVSGAARFKLIDPPDVESDCILGFSNDPSFAKEVAAFSDLKRLFALSRRLDANTKQQWYVGDQEVLKANISFLANRISKAAFANPKLGDAIINTVGQVFVWCPPGNFRMGSPKSELGRSYDETQVDVSLSRGFWISKYELTEREYEWIRRRTQPKPFGKNFPATGLRGSGDNAVAKSLNTAERDSGVLPDTWKYALPTEAQWEYACRAGTTSSYSFGNDPIGLSRHGNFADKRLFESDVSDYRYASRDQDDRSANVAPVGSYLPNAWGIHDMHGNVWEWCSDAYATKLPGGEDPTGPKKDEGRGRIMRGGSWISRPEYCRSAMRQAHHDAKNMNFIGLRLVIVPNE